MWRWYRIELAYRDQRPSVGNPVVDEEKMRGQWMIFPGYGPNSVFPSAHWLRGPAVEHWSLADVLSLSCALFVADG